MIEPTRAQDERCKDLAHDYAQVRAEPLTYEGAPLTVHLSQRQKAVVGEHTNDTARNGLQPVATVFIYADGTERWA